MLDCTQPCGLITRSQEPVPLRGISVDVAVRGFVADVVSELRYQNKEKAPVEAVFVFPLDDEAAVYAFEGLIGGTRIEARIQEKKKAEQEYEDALVEGREAFLLERQAETSDIFSCSLGNLPPGGEATLKLRYVQALAPEPDGAVRFVLPAVLNPRYDPQGSKAKGVTKLIPRLPKGKLPYSLSLKATLESPYAIKSVESKCSLTPINFAAQDHTSAQVSLAEGHQFDKDVELLIYYEEIHKPSALLEMGKTGAASGSLMGDPALLLTLYPSLPASKPALNATGEFIFLLDRSGSMTCNIGDGPNSLSRIQSAKETLVLLLKSLPLGCYFNIYGFGSSYDSFYPKSVEYTQETMSESLKRVKELDADLGGTEILEPLQAIYRQPFQEGHPRQLLVFTDGEVGNTDAVISEVRRHSSSHRCFSFGIGEGASTALIKGIARAAGGSAEFITGKERMQAKVLQSLKRALQPAVTGISLSWDLPSGLQAKVVGSGPQVIFEGQRCLIYAQILGQHQSSGATDGTVELQYTFQGQTIKEGMKFPLQAQESDRLPVHLLAAQTLLQELEGAEEKEKRHLALETSLSSGVVCSQTAYVGVNTELGKPLQGALVRRDIPLAAFQSSPMPKACFMKRRMRAAPKMMMCASPPGGACFHAQSNSSSQPLDLLYCATGLMDPDNDAYFSPNISLDLETAGPERDLKRKRDKQSTPKEEESPFLRLISLQNANGSWPLDTDLASLLGLSEAAISSKTPAQVVPDAWATVLAILWLHSKAAEQIDEWQLLEAKALRWLQATAGPQLTECVKAGNALLGSTVSLQALGL